MSKKNSPKKGTAREREQFLECVAEAILDARDFLETANPFEISVELTELGVTLSHAAGIIAFMKDYTAPAGDLDPLPPFEALGLHWEEEIARKRGAAPELEDCVFLTEVARHYWLNMKSPA
jgi:hypothetical protein